MTADFRMPEAERYAAFNRLQRRRGKPAVTLDEFRARSKSRAEQWGRAPRAVLADYERRAKEQKQIVSRASAGVVSGAKEKEHAGGIAHRHAATMERNLANDHSHSTSTSREATRKPGMEPRQEREVEDGEPGKVSRSQDCRERGEGRQANPEPLSAVRGERLGPCPPRQLRRADERAVALPTASSGAAQGTEGNRDCRRGVVPTASLTNSAGGVVSKTSPPAVFSRGGATTAA